MLGTTRSRPTEVRVRTATADDPTHGRQLFASTDEEGRQIVEIVRGPHLVASAGREDRDRAGAMLPSTQQTAFALGAALTGIIANALGFERMAQPGEFRTAAFWLFGGFVPPALIGSLIAWRFSNLIAGGRRSPPLGQ